MPKTAEELAVDAKLRSQELTDEESQDEEVTEDVEDDGEETVEVIEEADETVEVEDTTDSPRSESEIQARESGWKPKDEWDGDPTEWVSAEEFNRRGEYLRKIHNQNRKIKQLDDVVGTLAKQQKKIFEAGYDKAKRELKSALREANKEGDDATAEAIEGKIEQLDEQRKVDIAAVEIKVDPKQPDVAPEFAGWVQRNQWFIKKPALRSYAEHIGLAYAGENPLKTNTEVYQYVTTEVKKRFPEEFGIVVIPQKKKHGSPVVGSSDLTSGKRGSDSTSVVRVSLTSEEKAVGRALVDKGIYKNINEYATDLKKFGVKNT